jgi:hypothetical protein
MGTYFHRGTLLQVRMTKGNLLTAGMLAARETNAKAAVAHLAYNHLFERAQR